MESVDVPALSFAVTKEVDYLCNGETLIGSVDRIELSSSELSRRDVGNLRKMIKAEHNRLLKDFDPGDLSLYAKGTTIDDYHDQQPLRIGLPLSDDQIQGASEDNPLLVVLAPLELLGSTANTQQGEIGNIRKFKIVSSHTSGSNRQYHVMRFQDINQNSRASRRNLKSCASSLMT